MAPALFIDKNGEFTDRLRKEAKSKVIIAQSLVEGASLITDPNNHFNAIFFNPYDSSFSALKFLELALIYRPVTPLYMIDSKGELTSQQKTHFTQQRVMGFFTGQERYEDLTRHLKNKPLVSIDKNRKELTTRKDHFGYLSVPIAEFVFTNFYPFDVFLESKDGKLNLFAYSGSPVVPEYLSQAMESSSWFYVAESSIKEIREKILQVQLEMSGSQKIPITWKNAETIFKAKALLRELKSQSLSDSVVNQTHALLSDVFHLLTQLQSLDDTEKLAQFLEETRDSDRSIACATLSILMCKSLKFEKNAIVEILGIASLFEDISLYHSPHGNLLNLQPESMTPEQKEYFLKHPIHSADMLAKYTSIPDVTLQVIRQHHERKDRTGFPGKVGGMQLHPMAEVLSLINEMVDLDPKTIEDENNILRHYSDRIVNAYKQIEFRKKSVSIPGKKISRNLKAA